MQMLLSRFTDRLLPEVARAKQSKRQRETLADWTMPTYAPPTIDEFSCDDNPVIAKDELDEKSNSRELTNQLLHHDVPITESSHQKPFEYRRFVPYK